MTEAVIISVLAIAFGFAVGRWWLIPFALIVAAGPVIWLGVVSVGENTTAGGANIGAGVAFLLGALVVPPMLGVVIGVVLRKIGRGVRRRVTPVDSTELSRN